MKFLKHLFAALLLLCATSVAAHDFEVDGIFYEITNATNKTVAVTYSTYSNEYTGSVVIPQSVTYDGTTYSVTSIGRLAFRYCSGLTSVVIGNSVTSIGDYAFENCTGLTKVVIGNSVTSIGDSAFEECSGLTGELVIPNSVTSIGDYAFRYCSGLTSIVIGNSVTSIGNRVFAYCTGLTGKLEIPNSVTSIGECAFYKCSGLTSVVIGNSVTSIGEMAFSYCTGLTKVVIGNSVTSIGESAFYDCKWLKTVYNFSNLTFSRGTSKNGYVACYANKVINARNGFVDGDFVWFKNENGMTLAAYLGNATELSLPADCNGENYIIGADVFKGNTTITSVVIPNSVTSIGYEAFDGCTGLTSVEIGNRVTSIESSAFYGCSGLTSIVVDKNNTKYDSRENCNAIIETGTNTLVTGCKNTIIPNSVTSIGWGAFDGCTGLTSIVIPNSVRSIGEYAFNGCTGLKTVYNFSNLTFSKGSMENGYVAYYANKVYNVPNGCSIEGDFIFGKPNGVNTLLYYLGNATELSLPADCNGENYAIGAKVFNRNTTITSVIIPNSVTSIGDQAFNNCTGLTSVVIGNSVTSIGDQAFNNCTGLTGELIIPNSVTSIGWDAFYNCTGLKTVYNFSNLTFSKGSMENGCIAYYADKVYNAPNGSIEGDYIFGKPNGVNTLLYYLGNATELTLPADYKGKNYAIGANVFNGDTIITSVTIPNSVTSIGSSAFNGCSGLTSIVVDNNNTKYDSRENCNAIIETGANTLILGCKNTIIPNSVTSIGSYAFDGCIGLTSIVIPNSVTSIRDYAFNGCTSLKELRIADGEGTLFLGYNGNKEGLFYDCPLETLYLGRGLSYNTGFSYGYSPFYNNKTLTSVTIGNSVKSIREYAFYGCSSIASIAIPNSVTSIGNYAFAYCSGLTGELVIPNSVTSIGGSAFAYCTGLTGELVIPNSVTSIGSSAFYYCYGLTGELVIPNSVTSIGGSAFSGCSGLTSIVVDENNTKYDSRENCNAIIETGTNTLIVGCKNTIIPNSVTSIGSSAFEGCTGLTGELEIPNSVTSIGSSAFDGCTGLTSIVIPNSVTSIGGFAFEGCTGLTGELVIPNSVTSIGNYAFYGCKNITSIVIGNSVTSIGNYAFRGCSGLISITIPDGVKSIADYAFYNCSNVKSLYISSTIESIGNYAFGGCNNILDIKIGSEKAITASKNIFSNDAYVNAYLYVPTGRKDEYKNATPWGNFNIVEMDFTGIDGVDEQRTERENIYYDLNGRAVENPTTGIYILNGKKVLVK